MGMRILERLSARVRPSETQSPAAPTSDVEIGPAASMEREAIRLAENLFNRIEGPFGWASCRSANGIRLKDFPEYVAAYLAVKNAHAHRDTMPDPDTVPLADHRRLLEDALLARDKAWLKKLRFVEASVVWPWRGPITTLISITEREIAEKRK